MIISTAFKQLLITVWVAGHPITYTLPKLYNATVNVCQADANRLFAHRKHGVRMTIECIPSNKREA